MAHLKGQNVNLLLNLSEGSSATAIVAASTSCDFSITANTADASAKDDPGNGEWDNSEFQNYSWSCSNESFLVNINYLKALLDKVVNGNCEVAVQFQHKNSYGNAFAKKGKAIITSLDVDCPNGDNVKITLSLEGNGALESASAADITAASDFKARIKGKTLMIAAKVQSGSSEYAWKTLACSTSHKLSLSAQTADISDKDMNEKVLVKEVTGRSITLSTENLIEVKDAAGSINGQGINDLYGYITGGTTVYLCLGYYSGATGQSIHGQDAGWGTPTTILLEGSFTCTSLTSNGANKEDATFSAEFQGKGAPTVASLSAQSED